MKQLSCKALELLSLIFDEKSNLQLPVGTAKTIVEIQEWLKNETQDNPK